MNPPERRIWDGTREYLDEFEQRLAEEDDRDDVEEQGAEIPAEMREWITSSLDDVHNSRLITLRLQEELRNALRTGQRTTIQAVTSIDGSDVRFDMTLEEDAARPGKFRLLSQNWPECWRVQNLIVGPFRFSEFELRGKDMDLGIVYPSTLKMPKRETETGRKATQPPADLMAETPRSLAADSDDLDIDWDAVQFAADDGLRLESEVLSLAADSIDLEFAADSRTKPMDGNLAKGIPEVDWSADGKITVETELSDDEEGAFAVVEVHGSRPAGRLVAGPVAVHLNRWLVDGRWTGDQFIERPHEVAQESRHVHVTVRPLGEGDLHLLSHRSLSGISPVMEFLADQNYDVIALTPIEGGFEFNRPADELLHAKGLTWCLQAAGAEKGGGR